MKLPDANLSSPALARKAVAYVRRSTDRQDQSIGDQRRAIEMYAVSNGFEIEAVRHEDARLYACGAMVMGGPLASVDTFLGLQYTALRTAHDAHSVNPAAIRILNGWFSIRQWFKWARGKAP